MRKAYLFRIFPNKNQEVKLNSTLSTCRHLYNDALAERKRQKVLNELRRDFGIFPWGKPEWINYYDQANDLTESKTPFQGRNRYNSFTYPQSGFGLEDGKLTLSKIGSIKIIQHREIEGNIKTCTIRKDVDQWYVSFSVEMDEPVPVEIKTETGI
jgi:putative transposase